MQEIKKRRIVIASVLKPIDDTRMFEKMGISLAPFYDVDIIGYPSVKPPDPGAIVFHPLHAFKRLSLGRIAAPFRILFRTLKLKPKVFIITTHELLVAALLVKLVSGSKVIYDVRENYRLNILHTNAFPKIIRPLLASWVMVKEWFARFYVDHYILAERGYKKELFFPTSKYTILENKFRNPTVPFERAHRQDKTVRLLFSGTLNEGTGIFTAIDVAEKLRARSNNIKLTIIGYCAQEDVLMRLKKTITGKEYITLIGGDKLVPHNDIIQAIRESDFGIISYPPNASTENTIPTKLYEYLACHLPILLIQHPVWSNVASQYDAAINFDPDNLDVPKILQDISTKRFYTLTPSDIFWEDKALLKVTQQVIG